ncbi:Mitochondrial protein [Aphelenchoides bicaudatus]|nr:Mitochondrial protein [Aphelenchoides bicaudatus]
MRMLRMLRATRLKQLYVCRFASSYAHAPGKDHYSTLGILRTADAKQIKSAFYELSKKYHPDRNPDDKANASIKFQDVLNAYEVLSNTDKRKEYDDQVVANYFSGPLSTRRDFSFHAERRTDLDSDSGDLEYVQRMSRAEYTEVHIDLSARYGHFYDPTQEVVIEKRDRKVTAVGVLVFVVIIAVNVSYIHYLQNKKMKSSQEEVINY